MEYCRVAPLVAVRLCQPRIEAGLRGKLSVESGGVVFTTIQKFFPEEQVNST